MKTNTLQDFINLLEEKGQLRRITQPVAAELEITEIVDRISKGPGDQNKALLFENVQGSIMPGKALPVLVNMFGSAERMAWALHTDHLDELTANLTRLIDLRPPDNAKGALTRGLDLLQALRATGLKPRKVKRAPVQEIIETGTPSLDTLPILKCWPQDGGPFITLPQVVTRHPETGIRNVGMYRLQKVDSRTLLVHWQRHKGGAEHERVAHEQHRDRSVPNTIPAAIVLGGDPACIWSASAPLPPDIDEYLLAGWLRGRAVELVECVTQPLTVPAQAEIVIEGYVDLADQRPEGPFGDHTGYYTPVELFPAFHVTAITQRQSPIYPATVVGIPPMEDYWMGKATERLFLPLVKLFLPEVVDFAMPAAGVFHNLVLVSIKKRYPGHARKVLHGIWGLALLSLTKAIVVVDEWVDVHNPTEVGWQALGNVDWERDVIITKGMVDQLDHAAYNPAFGGKIGIDATAKLPEEGYTRHWPAVTRMTPETKAKIDLLWEKLG
ncbi:MAG: menaquinone biosynthesis decarboxylase [Anaerolineae bacterium]|nr:menaquinone biosynthesis decarboxylase [Anaerolineae bacterium]